ncbi:MAG: MBL fold metallo-hydrolase [Chitinophagaceae bacterium]|nr:MBL fold metallo-hydrolase [Chitinophagaceae bacterium]MCB9047435.1 MBL fold metallo-hydrolase [Chitinophagales bacterium]
MILEQIYTGCLAQGAYYIESNGEAVVIDPLREIQPYIDRAEKSGAKIKYVLETHFHADFVSGHIDLAKATGAKIVYGPTAQPGFDAVVAEDNQVFKVGNVTFKVLHTPGHTMESSCFLLADEQGKDMALFSGDTLFLGDVGRPDLAQKAAHMTQEQLAGLLFESLRNKVMPLADDVIVYPAHGAGSACGKKMSTDTMDTLGHQKKTNYALRADMTRDEFIEEVTTGLVMPPQYFPMNVGMNKMGYESIGNILERGTTPLSAQAFEAAAESDALVLDTRKAQDFAKGFIPGSINIGIDGNFAPWVGALITDIKQNILIVADKGREEEVVTRLARVGYDNSLGYLDGGIDAWTNAGKALDTIESITVEELKERMGNDPLTPLLDARKKTEFDSEHVIGAINLPLDFVNENMQQIDPGTQYHVYCAGGYRSMVFISILKARGFNNLVDIQGGFTAIKASKGFNISNYQEPVSML